MSRFQKVVIGLLVAVIVVIAGGVALVVKQESDAAAYRDLLICMASYGSTPDDPGTPAEALAAREACD